MSTGSAGLFRGHRSYIPVPGREVVGAYRVSQYPSDSKSNRWLHVHIFWFWCFQIFEVYSIYSIYFIEVHLSVKNCSPNHSYLRQGILCHRRWKDNKIFYSSRSSLHAKFLVQGFEVAIEIWPPENSPSKKCCHVGNHFIFASMYKVLHQRILGCSVNYHRTRVSLSTNQISKFP